MLFSAGAPEAALTPRFHSAAQAFVWASALERRPAEPATGRSPALVLHPGASRAVFAATTQKARRGGRATTARSSPRGCVRSPLRAGGGVRRANGSSGSRYLASPHDRRG